MGTKVTILITLTLACIAHLAGVTFFPGVNQIPEDEWNRLKARDDVKDMLKSGFLKIGSSVPATPSSDGTDGNGENLATGYSKMPLKDVVDIIKNTMTIEALDVIDQADSRKGVQSAIVAQRTLINEAADKAKKDQE